MASYIITYDLSKPGQNYQKVLEAIKAVGAWARLSESSYAVTSGLRPQQIFDRIKPHLDSNDQLYVIGLHRPYSGRGDQEVNNWLDRNLQAC